MLSKYLQKAMKKAHYELLPDKEGYFGKIEEMGHHIPVIENIDLNQIQEVA